MYELDLTGKNPANLVINERAIIANALNKYRCFIPSFAPFFAESVKLQQIISGKVVPLIEGIHYVFGHYYAEGEVATKKRVNGSVMLLEPMSGVLEFLEYQTMGGPTTTSKTAIASHLGDPNLPDPRNIDWAEVLKISTVNMAVQKPESYGEAISTDEIIAAIEGMNKAIDSTVGGTQDKAYLELQRSIASLHTRMIEEGYYTHWQDPAAHGVTVSTLGAYSRDDAVEDAMRAYSMTLDELAEYCRGKGVTESVIQSYLDQHTAFTGVLSVRSANPIQIPGSGVVITESDNGTEIAAEGAVTITADKGQKRSGVAASFHSGTHVLSTYSAGSNYRTKDGTALDGFPLIDKDNLANYLKGMTGSSAALNLKVRATATVVLSGNGSAGAPLKGDASFPLATEAQKGLMRVTNTVANMPAKYGCSTRILYELDKTVSQYALGIYTLNGKPLTADVTLGLNDFGLGAVNNTALADKPLSNPWTAAVLDKAVVGHVHKMHEEYQHATPAAAGTVMLSDTKSRTERDKAATVKLAKQYQQEIQTESGKTIRVIIGRTLQIGQVPASAPRIIKNGMFIAYEVA